MCVWQQQKLNQNLIHNNLFCFARDHINENINKNFKLTLKVTSENARMNTSHPNKVF